MHWLVGIIVSLTHFKVGEPLVNPELVEPHPATTALLPVKFCKLSGLSSNGKHKGLTKPINRNKYKANNKYYLLLFKKQKTLLT